MLLHTHVYQYAQLHQGFIIKYLKYTIRADLMMLLEVGILIIVNKWYFLLFKMVHKVMYLN